MSGKILIIDDESIVRNILARFFRREGFSPLTAEGGLEGIELAREWLPDIIVMDLLMPGINGYEAGSMLNKDALTKDIPIVYLSAIARESKDDPGPYSTEYFMVKPVKFTRLLEIIRKILVSEPA